MSNYRDDTQETIVLSSEAFAKVKAGDVENFGFSETILNKIKHNLEELLTFVDEDLSKRKGRVDSTIGFNEQVFHGVRKFQLVEEFFGLGDQTLLKQKEIVDENLGFAESKTTNYKAVHLEPFKINDDAVTYKTTVHSINDQIKLKDVILSLQITTDLIEESLTFSDSQKDKLKTLIVETLNLNQELQQQNHIKTLNTESLKFKDQAVHKKHDLIIDVLSFQDEIKKIAGTVDLIIEALSFGDTTSGQRRVTSLVESNIKLIDHAEGLKTATSNITEMMLLDDSYHDGREEIAAWTATAQGWSMSRYQDYPYEELIVIDGKVFGVTSHGIDELKAGAQVIMAQIKTAKLDLGDGGLIHPESMTLEYSLDGELSVDVGTTQTGYQQTFNYILKKEPSEYLTNGRVLFGRGLRGRHFDFAVNIEGSTAYVNDMVVNIIKTKRRI